MFLGIEIGGTKLQLGLGSGRGPLLACKRLPVHLANGAEGIRRQICQAVPELFEQAGVRRESIQRAGIGFGGPVDDASRRALKSHQVAGWDDFPLAEWAEETLGLPAMLGNDADLAGLAEAHLGAGKGLSPIFYTNVGSGIGGSLVIDGQVYRGTGQGAGEIGHLWLEHDLAHEGPPSSSPGWRIVEHGASGWAIAREAGLASAEEVARSAAEGNPRARVVIQAAVRRYALALSHVIALCCPRRIVIGGGVTEMGDELFFSPLRREVARMVFRPFAACYDIVPAALGQEVVVHGALVLARLGPRALLRAK